MPTCLKVCVQRKLLCIMLIIMSVISFQPQTLQLDFLMKILPNYHHLKKTVKAGHAAS